MTSDHVNTINNTMPVKVPLYVVNSFKTNWTNIQNSICHRRAVAKPCVNGDQLSQWRMAKFDPAQIQNPQPIDTKFETDDYIREMTPCAKCCANPSIGGFSANGWNITKIFLVYIYIPFLLTELQVRPPGGFSRAMARTMRPHTKVKPFREPKFEVNI